MNKVRRITFFRAIAISAIALVVLVVLMTGSAFAITGNWVPDNEHPFVGLVVIYDEYGEFLWRGSGSLISPTVVLTAGHVVDTALGAASARVYFQQDAGAHYDPDLGYDPVSGYPDYALRTMACRGLHTSCTTTASTTSPASLILMTPASSYWTSRLPCPSTASSPRLGCSTPWPPSVVCRSRCSLPSGYGLSYAVQEHSALSDISYRSRLMARSTLVNLKSANTDGFNLQTQGNGNGRGGTCFGDSGGPVFLGGPDSNLIVGVNSFGMNSLCRGTDYAYRIDTQEVLDWINGGYLED